MIAQSFGRANRAVPLQLEVAPTMGRRGQLNIRPGVTKALRAVFRVGLAGSIRPLQVRQVSRAAIPAPDRPSQLNRAEVTPLETCRLAVAAIAPAPQRQSVRCIDCCAPVLPFPKPPSPSPKCPLRDVSLKAWLSAQHPSMDTAHPPPLPGVPRARAGDIRPTGHLRALRLTRHRGTAVERLPAAPRRAAGRRAVAGRDGCAEEGPRCTALQSGARSNR